MQCRDERLSDQLLFEVPLPSPLGRVAERSEVGRGSLPHCFSCAFPQTKAQKPLPSALRAAFIPQRGGEGKRKAHHTFKQQFICQCVLRRILFTNWSNFVFKSVIGCSKPADILYTERLRKPWAASFQISRSSFLPLFFPIPFAETPAAFRSGGFLTMGGTINCCLRNELTINNWQLTIKVSLRDE